MKNKEPIWLRVLELFERIFGGKENWFWKKSLACTNKFCSSYVLIIFVRRFHSFVVNIEWSWLERLTDVNWKK